MTINEELSDEPEPPASIKMPDLAERQKEYSQGLTDCLRAKGIIHEDEEAAVEIDESGRITAILLDGMSAQHAENLMRSLTALKLHGSEEPDPIKTATIEGLSPVEYLDRERKQRERPNKPRGGSSSTKIR